MGQDGGDVQVPFLDHIEVDFDRVASLSVVRLEPEGVRTDERYFFEISPKLLVNLSLQKYSLYLSGYACAFCMSALLSILNLLLKKISLSLG